MWPRAPGELLSMLISQTRDQRCSGLPGIRRIKGPTHRDDPTAGRGHKTPPTPPNCRRPCLLQVAFEGSGWVCKEEVCKEGVCKEGVCKEGVCKEGVCKEGVCKGGVCKGGVC